MRSDPSGGVVGFDPSASYCNQGRRCAGCVMERAYRDGLQPEKSDNHSLRIPTDAKAWDSGFLLPGQHFEVKLTIEGAYDYYCAPHEMAGMVGRIIVGKRSGPGTLPFDYFKAEGKTWRPVPPAAQKAFPSVRDIMREKTVPSPLNFSQ